MDTFFDIINLFKQLMIESVWENKCYFLNGGAFMKRMKKLTSIGLVLAMTVGLLAGCYGSGSGKGEDASTSGGKGR